MVNIDNYIFIPPDINEKEYKNYIGGLLSSIKNYYSQLKNKKLYDNLNKSILQLNQILKLNIKDNHDFVIKNVDKIISKYGCVLMQSDRTNYHTEILFTNIKRWNRILKRDKFPNQKFYKILRIFKWFVKTVYFKYKYNFSEKILGIYKDLYYIFHDINTYNINEKFNQLVYISIKYNKPNMVDHLKYIFNFPKHFKLNIEYNTKGYKILKLLKSNDITF